jgi:hypothetical protein
MSTASIGKHGGDPVAAEIPGGRDRATPHPSQNLTANGEPGQSEFPQLRLSPWGRMRLAAAERAAERYGQRVLAAIAEGRSPELDPRKPEEKLSAMAIRAGWGGAR